MQHLDDADVAAVGGRASAAAIDWAETSDERSVQKLYQ
jgi:hypothetical protein